MKYKVIFFHGFESSNETNKFTIIKGEKVCVNVDYAVESYEQVYSKYESLISSVVRDDYEPILVGHSLGGYWANLFGKMYDFKTLLLNPQLFPTNEKIRDVEWYDSAFFDKPKYQICYVEVCDEVIDVQRTIDYFPAESLVLKAGGHHRIKYLQNVNKLIEELIRK